jgi:uncharacterized protein (TIGR02246 family)
VDRAGVQAWIERYERAWRTAGTDAVAELFTDDATYRMEPLEPPVRGLAGIRALWEAERDGADEAFTMHSEIVAVDGDTAVVRVGVRYAEPPREYRDLWILRFDQRGWCTAFEEWPFAPKEAGGRA